MEEKEISKQIIKVETKDFEIAIKEKAIEINFFADLTTVKIYYNSFGIMTIGVKDKIIYQDIW
jgi:hypothetical protein